MVFNPYKNNCKSVCPCQHFTNILIVRVYLNLNIAKKNKHLFEKVLPLLNYEIIIVAIYLSMLLITFLLINCIFLL